MTRKITKQQALELFGVDMDNVIESDVVHFNKRYEDGDDDTPDDAPRPMEKLTEMVAAMIAIMPSLSPAHAMRFLATPPGTALINSLSKKEQPMTQVDIFKLHNVASVVEIAKSINSGEAIGIPFAQVLMGHARLNKRSGESDAKAFTRLYESDVEFRKADQAATQAGWVEYSKASYPGVMTVEVVSTEVGSGSVSDDSWKAAAQLAALVEEQRARAPTLTTSQLYERVYADPANRTITGRAHPTTSSTSGSELQR
jgi:hypothetical protein